MSEQQVMVITGSSKGIGRYLAGYYAGKGFKVIGCSRSSSDLQQENYQHFPLNVSDEEAVRAMFSSIRKDYGALHCLVNNAGITAMNHCLLMPGKTVRSVLDTNVIGTYLMCREAAKLMSKKKYGRIVNLATNIMRMKVAGESIYIASKHAVVGLTEVLATEFAELGITVNAMGPTPMRTDAISGLSDEGLQGLLNRQAIKRASEFADLSNVIDFFISPASGMISGQVVYLGGV